MDDLSTINKLADLDSCAREPIHVPGQIQPFGFLVALEPDSQVSHVSANIAEFTGHPPHAWLGHPLKELILPSALHKLRNQIASLYGPNLLHGLNAI